MFAGHVTVTNTGGDENVLDEEHMIAYTTTPLPVA